MKLSNIHQQFNTDKGNGHNYIDTYEELFSERREEKLNVLEIGVLLGGSLKLWEHYFENSNIYGIDDFSQQETNEDFGGEPVNAERVKKELSVYDRINFIECNSRDKKVVEEKIGSLNIEFDIIIDDADHKLQCQIDNFVNFMPYLSKNGIYIIEDCQNMREAEYLKQWILDNYDGPDIQIIPLDIENRGDDILMIIR